MQTYKLTQLIGCALLSLGIFGAGYTIGRSIFLFKDASRIVAVKGIAEQEVASDLGIWEINYRQMGNNLTEVNQAILADREKIIGFLKKQGFQDKEITNANYSIHDRDADIYNQTPVDPNKVRYIVTTGIKIRSANVALIASTVQIINQLLQEGIALTFESSTMTPNPSYYFTQLDQIRSSMLSNATQSANTLATQFAEQMHCHLAGIQHANQGVFQIMSHDMSTLNSDWNSNQSALGSILKKVRLVASLDYRLKCPA